MIWLIFTFAIAAWIAYRYLQMKHHQCQMITHQNESEYVFWKKILANQTLPIVLINLDAFHSNLKKLTQLIEASNRTNRYAKTIRLATKSIRVPALIKYALENGGPLMKGVLCYAASEAELLWQQGICNDFLIAYPTVQSSDLKILSEMHHQGALVTLVLDHIEQMEKVAHAMQNVIHPFSIIIELDTSIHFWNGIVHLGSHRSPIHTLEELRMILRASKKYKNLQVVGVIAYESAVAGLADENPYKSKVVNLVANLIRRASVAYAAHLRAQVPQIFSEEGLDLKIFNGGGTGSINFTAVEESGLNEISFGSGLLNSHLFNHYSNLKKLHLEPSIYFAIPIVRTSDNHHVTCYEGGYIASGAPGKEKLPRVISPAGLEVTETEGFGEVQTPFYSKKNIMLKSGDPVICRPAKAGELAKFFNSYLGFSKQPTLDIKENQKFVFNYFETYRKYGL